MKQAARFVCPFCHTSYNDPRAAAWLGRKVRCGKCGNLFVLEQIDQPATPPVPAPAPGPEAENHVPALTTQAQVSTADSVRALGEPGAATAANPANNSAAADEVRVVCPFCWSEGRQRHVATVPGVHPKGAERPGGLPRQIISYHVGHGQTLMDGWSVSGSRSHRRDNACRSARKAGSCRPFFQFGSGSRHC
jgi:hypothetical protein